MAGRKKKAEDDPCEGCNGNHCKECEHKERRALALADAERMTREVRTQVIEGDHPYDRAVYVSEVRLYLTSVVADIIEAGKRLLVIKEREGYGEFVKICEEDLGIPHTTAYRFMNAALKAEKFPTIADFPRVGKVYALLEAPEEDLKELETKGVLAGNSIEDLQRMSVREMRDTIRKLRTEVDKVVKEETKGLKAENKALVEKLKRLEPFDPESKSKDWCVEQLKAIEAAVADVDNLIRRFVFKDNLKRVKDDLPSQAKLNGIIESITTRAQMLSENFDAFLEDD